MVKNILHLGAGKLMINNVKLLQKDGYKVYLVDKDVNAPAFIYADGFSSIDVIDIDNIRKYAIDINAHAIMAVNDAGVRTAAIVSQDLKLGYINQKVAEESTDKGLMRLRWATNNVSQPHFIIAENEQDIRNAIQKIGFPCVLKPCLNWGSRGVSVINSNEDIDWSIQLALDNNRNNRFIIEEFIDGLEVTVEGLIVDSDISILACSDKEHQEHPKYKVAMALNYPANLNEENKNELYRIIKQAAISLEINNSAYHAECMIRNNEIFLVEMAARPGGGHIFGYIVGAASGVTMPNALARILLNEKVDIQPKEQNGACYKFFNAPKGIFQELQNLEEARSVDGVLDIGFDLKPGTKVDAISGDADRPGYIVTKGIDREDAIRIANKALNILKFIVHNDN